MTVRVRRTFEFDVPPERVWEFISDPGKRAAAISVVRDYDVRDERTAIWHIKLPIPIVNTTVSVETEDVTRDPPHHVEFVGRSRVMEVTGTHTVEPTDRGSRLENEFVVEGKLPGVERFFEKNLDRELGNLEDALRRDFEVHA